MEDQQLLSRGRVPNTNRVVILPTGRNPAAVRAESYDLYSALVPPQDRPSVLRVTDEMPPLPAAVLGRGIVQGPLGGPDVVQLQRAGGGDQVSPVVLPALGLFLALGLVAGAVGRLSLDGFVLPRIFCTKIAPRNQHKRRQEYQDDARQRRGHKWVPPAPADPFLDLPDRSGLDRPPVEVTLQVVRERRG